MDPLTAAHLPKPLFPLGGKLPLVEVWVRRLVESGITDISMNLCVLSETIKRHFGDGSKFAAKINYVDEAVPSGTLGGVCKQAFGSESKRLPSERDHPGSQAFKGSTVIAPSGDIVTNFGSGFGSSALGEEEGLWNGGPGGSGNPSGYYLEVWKD